MAEEVGRLNVRGCFMEKDPEKYIQTVADAHELLRKSAALVSEAREVERENDSLYRTPHSSDGRILRKTRLMEKPE
jgi:methylenetetrahydromethanopterin dehydrogenase